MEALYFSFEKQYPRLLTPRGPEFSYKNFKFFLFPVAINRCLGKAPSQMSVNTLGLWGLRAPLKGFGIQVLEHAASCLPRGLYFLKPLQRNLSPQNEERYRGTVL